MKKCLIFLLVIVLIVISAVGGFFLEKNYNKSDVQKSNEPRLYLPIYEYNSAVDDEISYDNIAEDSHGAFTFKLSRVIPCEYDICKWIPLDHSSTYHSNWIMYDGEDPNNNEAAKGGYYFFNWKKDKKVEGPFEYIELVKPSGDWALRLVLVMNEGVYGLYDISSKEFVLPLDSNYIEILSDSHFVYTKDGTYFLYEIQGNSKKMISEYSTLEDLYSDYKGYNSL